MARSRPGFLLLAGYVDFTPLPGGRFPRAFASAGAASAYACVYGPLFLRFSLYIVVQKCYLCIWMSRARENHVLRAND